MAFPRGVFLARGRYVNVRVTCKYGLRRRSRRRPPATIAGLWTRWSARVSSRNLSSLARTRFSPCERQVSALSVCADRQARRCESWRGNDSRIESELRIETKILLIGSICRNVAAERFRVRPARACLDYRPDGIPRDWLAIQTPLHHEVWTRSRAHNLSKSDL